MTPEGRVKKKVSALLASKGETLWYHMPVVNGYGKPTLDYTGAYYGLGFAIETKAKGKKLTLRQEKTAKEMRAAGIIVFVIDDVTDEALAPLDNWLKVVGEQHDVVTDTDQ